VTGTHTAASLQLSAFFLQIRHSVAVTRWQYKYGITHSTDVSNL